MKLRVVALAAPGVAVLRAIGDEQQEPRRRQPLDQAVQEGLRLGIDPVEILDDEDQGPRVALARDQPLQSLMDALPALGGIAAPPSSGRGAVQQREERGQQRLQRGVERPDLRGDLVADLVWLIAVGDIEIAPEQVDEGEVAGALAIRDRRGFERPPPPRPSERASS